MKKSDLSSTETKDIIVIKMEELLNLLENYGVNDEIKEKATDLKEGIENRINFYNNYIKNIYPYSFFGLF